MIFERSTPSHPHGSNCRCKPPPADPPACKIRTAPLDFFSCLDLLRTHSEIHEGHHDASQRRASSYIGSACISSVLQASEPPSQTLRERESPPQIRAFPGRVLIYINTQALNHRSQRSKHTHIHTWLPP
jgi:hypothetical protein